MRGRIMHWKRKIILILLCTVPVLCADTAYLRREQRYNARCTMTNYTAFEIAGVHGKMYKWPIFRGTKGTLRWDKVAKFHGQSSAEHSCYDLPVGVTKSKQFLRDLLVFYNEQLLGGIDIEHPTYMRLFGNNFGWYIIYEFTDHYGEKGYIRMDVPAPVSYSLRYSATKNKKLTKASLSDIEVNEEEILAAYKKYNGVTPYTGPYTDPHDGSKLPVVPIDDERLQSLKDTAGYINVGVNFGAPSPWHCPVPGNYENCTWRGN